MKIHSFVCVCVCVSVCVFSFCSSDFHVHLSPSLPRQHVAICSTWHNASQIRFHKKKNHGIKKYERSPTGSNLEIISTALSVPPHLPTFQSTHLFKRTECQIQFRNKQFVYTTEAKARVTYKCQPYPAIRFSTIESNLRFTCARLPTPHPLDIFRTLDSLAHASIHLIT